LKARIPTWPEQCDGTPTSGCSSKIETDALCWAAARAAIAPLIPHPATAMSTDLDGKIHLLVLTLREADVPELA
jgi:hypothetical protein